MSQEVYIFWEKSSFMDFNLPNVTMTCNVECLMESFKIHSKTVKFIISPLNEFYIYIYFRYIYIQGVHKVPLPWFFSICIKTINARNMVLVSTYWY